MSYQRYRPNDMPPVIKNLIIINAIVLIAQLTLNNEFGITNKIAIWPIKSGNFEPYQLVTHMFAHGGIPHLVFNMFFLWLFGKKLENLWQPKRFLIFYLACGVVAGLFSMGIDYFMYDRLLKDTISTDPSIVDISSVEMKLRKLLGPALGASGAVMGVVVAFGFLFPNTEMGYPLTPIPVKAKWLVLLYIAGDLFGGIANRPGDNVAHFAHLGGALTGFLIVLYWNKTNRKSLY